MVDVRGVKSPKLGYVDITNSILMSGVWLAVQVKSGNIQLTCEPSEVLDSAKYSWRMLGEMLLDLQSSDNLPDWARVEWLMFDLKEHATYQIDVRQKPLGIQLGTQLSTIPTLPYGWTRECKPGVYEGVTPEVERAFNKAARKAFYSKYPLYLTSLSPLKGSVTLGIPVRANPGGATRSEKMERMMRGINR